VMERRVLGFWGELCINLPFSEMSARIGLWIGIAALG